MKIGPIEGMNYRRGMLPDELSKDPKKTISMREVRTRFKVVYQTARTDLLGLEGREGLRKISALATYISGAED